MRRGQAGVDHQNPWWQRPAVLFLIASLIWGSTWLAITYQLGHVAPEAWTFDVSAQYIGSLLYLAVFGSVVAFGSYLTLLSKVGAGPSSYVGVATPVLAMVLSTLLESYRWSWIGMLGVGLAVCGNVVVLRAPRCASIDRAAAGLG